MPKIRNVGMICLVALAGLTYPRPGHTADIRGRTIVADFGGAPFTFRVLKNGRIYITYDRAQTCDDGSRLGYVAVLGRTHRYEKTCQVGTQAIQTSTARFANDLLDVVVRTPGGLTYHWRITVQGNRCSGDFVDILDGGPRNPAPARSRSCRISLS